MFFRAILFFALMGTFCFSSAGARGAVPCLEAKSGPGFFDVQSAIEVLQDASGELTLSEILNPEKDLNRAWSTLPLGLVNMGMTKDAVWLHFCFTNTARAESLRQLLIDNPRLSEVNMFTVVGRQIIDQYAISSRRNFHERPLEHPAFLFPLKLQENAQIDIFLQIRSDSPVRVPISIWEKESLELATRKNGFFNGAYFGALLLIILYNLFLFLSSRDQNFLHYVGYTTSVSLLILVKLGYGFQYLWPTALVWQEYAFVVAMTFTHAFMLSFIGGFLNYRDHHPRINRVINGLIWINLLAIPYALGTGVYHSTKLLYAFTSALMPIIFMLIGNRVIRGDRMAAVFLVAFLLPILASLSSVLQALKVTSSDFNSSIALQFGSFAELVLLAFAIGYRIKQERLEKIQVQHLALLNERKAREAQGEALAALENWNQLKDAFLASTSHELRTPLVGIIGLAETLVRQEQESGSIQVRRNSELILNCGRRLLSLVNDILDFSKLKEKQLTVQLSPVSLYLSVEHAIDIVRPLTGTKNITLINEIPTHLETVSADPERLQQILINLLGNAIKFTSEGKISVCAYRDGGRMMIEVSDTGIGIEPAKISRLFRSFEQLDGTNTREFGGTGLGLAISKQLVELHGGSIEVTSMPGQGSVFRFHLAYYPKDAGAGQPQAIEARRTRFQAHQEVDAPYSGLGVETSTAISSKPMPKVADLSTPIVLSQTPTQRADAATAPTPPSILVVDDDGVNLEVISQQLVAAGYAVILRSDGQQALDYLEQGLKPSLVLLDIMMPGLSGIQVAQGIRKKFSAVELPIFYLTARDQTGILIEAFEAGGNDYLVKPISQEELAVRIACHLQILDAARKEAAPSALATREEFWTEAAQAVQRSLLRLQDVIPDMELAYFKEPATIPHGDWMLSCYDAKGRRALLVIAHIPDVGLEMAVPSGVISAAVRNYVRSLQETSQSVDDQVLLEKCRDLALQILQETMDKSSRPLDLAFLSFQLDTGRLMLRTSGENSQIALALCNSNGISLCSMASGSLSHHTESMHFAPDDTLLIAPSSLCRKLCAEIEGKKDEFSRIFEEAQVISAPLLLDFYLREFPNIFQNDQESEDILVIALRCQNNRLADLSSAA